MADIETLGVGGRVVNEDSTRARILNVAGAIFAEEGFEKATIREIARRAEVNLASINYHFGDKERLYVETIKHAHRFRTEQAPLPDWPEGVPVEQKLRDYIRTTITWMLVVEELPWQHQLMMREMMQPTGACREVVEDFIRPHFGRLLSILEEMTPEEMPEHRRMQLGFSVIGQCLFYRFHRGVIDILLPDEERAAHFQPEQIADHVTDVILAALERRPLSLK